MSASRVIASRFGCSNCQRRTLNTFASFANLSIGPTRATPIPRAPARHLATARRLQNEAETKMDRPPPSESEASDGVASRQDADKAADEPTSSQAATTLPHPNVPWYLRDPGLEQAEERKVSSQELPELPANAPERLEAMIRYLFLDIGLDDVQILDLRKMNPPPALGSNLIMVLGTARSYQHLNNSANRFCKWLRSTYRISPFADGLLGRSELKVKLRRIAKGAKLLGSKGPAGPPPDDGFQTGWICVNVGVIEDRRHADWWDAELGTHLVVQMMTKQRREDLNLEKLWLDALARQERRDLRHQEGLEEIQPVQQEVEEEALQVRRSGIDRHTLADTVSSHRAPSPTSTQSQIRGLHTQRRLSSQTFDSSTLEAADTRDQEAPSSIPQPNAAVGMTSRAQIFRSQDRPKLPQGLESDLHALTTLPSNQAVDKFHSTLQDAARVHPLEITSDLKRSQDVSTDYHLMFRVWLASFAMLLEHPDYTPEAVRAIFATLKDKPRSPLWLHRIAVDAFLPAESLLDSGPPLDRETLAVIFRSLAICRAEDYAFDDTTIFERLYLGKLRSLIDPSTGRMRPDRPFGAVHVKKLLKGLGHSDEVRLSESFHEEALKILQTAPDLEAFFAHWESIPIFSGSRNAAMYEILFRGLLSSGRPVVITKALDEWVSIMDHESPPVAIEGGIAEALAGCLQMVDPHIEMSAREDISGKNFYAAVWRECQHALGP